LRSTTRRKGKADSLRLLLLPAAIAAIGLLLSAGAAFAQTAPAPAAPGRPRILQWEKYQQDVIARERQEHAQRVEAQNAAANAKKAADARRLQAGKDEADRQALNKKRAAQAYEKSVVQRETDEHARRIAMAPKPPAKPPVTPPVAVTPKPKPPVTPPVRPPVAVAPTTPVTPTPPKPVAPPVAAVPPAQPPAYESGVKTAETRERAQRLKAENRKKAELAKHQKEMAQHENTVKAREIEEHRRREEAHKAADAARKAALFDFGM
jgi:hypothetical protein